MWESNSLFYIIVLCQIVVTLVLVPRLIKANLVNSFKPYLDEQDERLKLSLEQALSKLIKHYLIIYLYIKIEKETTDAALSISPSLCVRYIHEQQRNGES